MKQFVAYKLNFTCEAVTTVNLPRYSGSALRGAFFSALRQNFCLNKKSQVIEDLSESGCILKLKIGSLMEITPWIRSWGPEMEVVEPGSLRREFRAAAGALYQLYDAGSLETR